ncbi:glycosyltransferase family protein [Spirochaeta dissipatitropha]
MNTILTHSDSSAEFTVVGGGKSKRQSTLIPGLSILVLHRGGRFNRSELLEELENMNVREIIMLEQKSSSYDVEQLVRRFPKVKFMLLHNEMNPGGMINMGIREAVTEHVLVLWNTANILSMSERVLHFIMKGNWVCAAPLFRNDRAEVIPTISMPAFFKKSIRLIPAIPSKDGQKTLFPYDYTGIYNTDLFLKSGGYDSSMKSQYWQKMDFGMRVFLWGQSNICCASFRMQQSNRQISEDSTPNIDYVRFFLRNVAVLYAADFGKLPATVLIKLLLKSPFHPYESIREFRKAKKWVEDHKFHYTQDARRLLELWEEQ